MHKVVVERPRHGRSWAESRPRPKPPFDDSPSYESMKARHTRRKSFSDLLGPLRRWLNSQVGRPWNDVYAEACAVIKPNSVIRAHVKTHLLQFVERHTFMRDGEVWCFSGWWSVGEMRIERAGRFRSSFFVHPTTGLLCKIPELPRWRLPDPIAQYRNRTQRWLGEWRLLRQLNGCWFECHVAPFPQRYAKGESPWRYDVAEKKLICRANGGTIYGFYVHCVSKRQLSRHELKQFKLINSPERSPQSVAGILRTALGFAA